MKTTAMVSIAVNVNCTLSFIAVDGVKNNEGICRQMENI